MKQMDSAGFKDISKKIGLLHGVTDPCGTIGKKVYYAVLLIIANLFYLII